MLTQLHVLSHIEQVIVHEKCFVLSRECSFAILLQSACHGKNVTKSFVDAVLFQKNSIHNSGKMSNHRFSTGQKQVETCVFLR